jgi:hypothetical protein
VAVVEQMSEGGFVSIIYIIFIAILIDLAIIWIIQRGKK